MSGNMSVSSSSAGPVTWDFGPASERRTKITQVTEGEQVLYGDFAPVVRDLGSAIAGAQQAFRTLRVYVDEARGMPPVTSDETPGQGHPPFERGFEIVGTVLAALAEAQRAIVREALDEVERSNMQLGSHETAPSSPAA